MVDDDQEQAPPPLLAPVLYWAVGGSGRVYAITPSGECDDAREARNDTYRKYPDGRAADLDVLYALVDPSGRVWCTVDDQCNEVEAGLPGLFAELLRLRDWIARRDGAR